jgi:hypothetical protein
MSDLRKTVSEAMEERGRRTESAGRGDEATSTRVPREIKNPSALPQEDRPEDQESSDALRSAEEKTKPKNVMNPGDTVRF